VAVDVAHDVWRINLIQKMPEKTGKTDDQRRLFVASKGEGWRAKKTGPFALRGRNAYDLSRRVGLVENCHLRPQ
jgi:hypothetical protein